MPTGQQCSKIDDTKTTSHQEEGQGGTEPQQSDVVARPLESKAS